MQRYHLNNCNSAVNNSLISGIQPRDASRSESSANYSLNSRRSSQVTPYKARCDKEQLNPRLGPPDFNPQTPTCPEETLTREYAQSGYRETVEGLEEAREISLSHVQAFNKPLIVKWKEAIKKRHRAINESRVQKRKAGQVYGVSLSGALLTKPGIFPDQRPCSEDFRRKWIEGLSQPHKRLRSLADHVPHGYRKRSLFEVLIRNNVPLTRATWFIKVTYLNQVRVTSNSSSTIHDKTQFSRCEQWTKDVIDYLQSLLGEFVTRNNSYSSFHMRDRPSQMVYASSVQPKGDPFASVMDGEEPSLYNKWWYVVRIIQWHHVEGLVVPSLIIDWVLNQLQEKEMLGVLQLLLPIIYGFIEIVILSQTYVRTLVRIATRFIQEPSPGGSDLVDNSRRAYTNSAVVEMLRYLILAVPDTFVALDCFPLPKSVVSHLVNDGNFLPKLAEEARNMKDSQLEVASAHKDKHHEVQAESLSFHSVVSSIQCRAETLSRAARPNHCGHSIAKALQVLDQSLRHGDIGGAYKLLFEDPWDGAIAERWVADVSSNLHTSLKHIGGVTLSINCSIFFICEWATCEYRDFRNVVPTGLKFTGRKDYSEIFIAIRLLKLMMKNIPSMHCSNRKVKDVSDTFESLGPLHDAIVCWIDQHEVQNGEGFKRVQLLIRELVCSGIFNPQAYVRQLIVSGIMDGIGSIVDMERRKKHCKLLKHLPAPYVCDALIDAHLADPQTLLEAASVYSNERRLALHGLLGERKFTLGPKSSTKRQKYNGRSDGGNVSPSFIDQLDSQAISSLSTTDVETNIKLEELKASISALLQLRHPSSSVSSVLDESQVTFVRSDGIYNRAVAAEETSGCEECRRTKRQKISEERSSHLQSSPAEEEDLWWVRKGMKYVEPLKSEQPPKPAKQAPRGRQKSVRKTQSLAHLAATRIEGSQGASPSHVCENRIGCPHHRTGSDDVRKSIDGIKTPSSGDVVSIGKYLKQMKFAEKRTITTWLISVIKQALEEAEKNVPKIGQHSKPLSAAEDRSSTRWKLGEDELSAALYIMDTCNELVSATRFLLWLLSKLPCNSGSATHSRNVLIIPRFAENHACEVGEAFLLSSIRRYENIIVAADLLPEILSATMRRAASVLESNGRLSSSPAFIYARHIFKKYSNAVSVVEWEKDFKSSCDKRLSSELQSGRSEGDIGFSFGVPNGVEDLDDYFRQRISGHRVSRVGLNMKDIVHKLVDEATKDRKSFVPGSNKSPSIENSDGGYPIAHQVVTALMDCMRQTGGAAQEGDPSLVSSAVAAIVNNVALVIARISDLPSGSNHLSLASPSSSLLFARRILRIHMACLCILKEALGERQSRVFEVALATEASSALVQTLAPGKAQNLLNDASNHSHKAVLGKAAKVTAAVSALVIGAILQGVSSLDRMVTLFKLRDGLDLIQFARSMKSNVNGHARSSGPVKVDHSVEVSVNWFRVLVGNCRTVSDGLIVHLLGEPSVLALSRMQRMLSLNLVLPPAYSIFAFVIWRPILDASFGVREEFNQLYQLSIVAITDAIKHMPFREICLRDTRGFYELVSGDTLDLDFISLLESNNSEIKLKASALVPLRSRLFLDALLDCKVSNVVEADEGKKVSSPSELKKQCGENVKKLVGRLVNVLDTLQPARFHWQWVQLRLFLNEQAVNEKMENDVIFSEAIKSLSANPDKSNACDNESNFIQIILTRLLVRPDAAPFFSEVIHLLGKSLEDSILSQAKWLLRGSEVLYGRKSIRQKVINIAADLKDLPMKPQYWKPWGWYHSESNIVTNRGDKGKSEAGTLEEGEVVDERPDFNQFGKGSGVLDVEGFIVSQQHATERALMKLILPCLDQGSDDLRYSFASEMIKQMSNIEQKINAVTRGDGKVAATSVPAIGSPPSKSSSRKTGKNSSPAIARQSTGSSDTVPPSPTALRSSLTLRLQFLLRLLRVIWSDREPSGRNMRYTLASVILRLLGSRVVHEDVSHMVNTALVSLKRDGETLLETSTLDALLCGENLFDCLLLVLHALLSSCLPSWLKLKSESNSSERRNDHSVFDREVAESLQNELDSMELPQRIRWRIQAAMPILFPASRSSISCQATLVSPAAITCLQPSNPVTFLNPSSSSAPQRTPVFPGRNSGNSKPKSHTTQQDPDQEIDPWTLLEDGAGSGQCSPNSACSTDHSNLKASNLVKGAVRVRRTYLTYIGTVDEDS